LRTIYPIDNNTSFALEGRGLLMAQPNQNAPVGQGGRFAALKEKLSAKPGVTNPGALAASIGRKKYGKSGFQKMAAAGKK
jgi:hypothetical protein